MKTEKDIVQKLSDKDKTYISILINQAQRDDLKGRPIQEIGPEQMITLLESRKIYLNLYGFQYADEDKILSNLIDIFKKEYKDHVIIAMEPTGTLSFFEVCRAERLNKATNFYIVDHKFTVKDLKDWIESGYETGEKIQEIEFV